MTSPRVATLADRVNVLGPGKVLDVSHLDPNGRGARVVPAPRSVRSGKLRIGDFPIISNNAETYLRALELIYGPEVANQYRREIEAIQWPFANPQFVTQQIALANPQFITQRSPQLTVPTVQVSPQFTVPRVPSPESPRLTVPTVQVSPRLLPRAAPSPPQVNPYFTIPVNPVTPTLSPTRGPSLAEKVNRLGPGYVLDVSNLAANGTGARVVLAPRTSRSGNIGIPDIPVISNNSANYARALEEIYGPTIFDTYRTEFEKLRAANPNW